MEYYQETSTLRDKTQNYIQLKLNSLLPFFLFYMYITITLPCTRRRENTKIVPSIKLEHNKIIYMYSVLQLEFQMSVLWDVRDSTVVNQMEMNYKYCMWDYIIICIEIVRNNFMLFGYGSNIHVTDKITKEIKIIFIAKII